MARNHKQRQVDTSKGTFCEVSSTMERSEYGCMDLMRPSLVVKFQATTTKIRWFSECDAPVPEQQRYLKCIGQCMPGHALAVSLRLSKLQLVYSHDCKRQGQRTKRNCGPET